MNIEKRRENAVRKELLTVSKEESRLERTARKAKPAGWKTALEAKLPEKVYKGLESAFCKGFSLVFEQGKNLIERGIPKENVRADHAIRDYAVQRKGGRKELRQLHKSVNHSNLRNLAVTTAEGIGLGALGIGMPDIVLFLGTLLGGIYETALGYGFEYDSRPEQLFILKLMEAALSTGEDWTKKNAEADELLHSLPSQLTEEEFQSQLKQTASVFAMDMLLLKFIQGIPIIGILGGASNPVCYNKVMKYVRLKYRKRYLLRQL